MLWGILAIAMAIIAVLLIVAIVCRSAKELCLWLKEKIRERPTCAACRQEIDDEVCWCGDYIEGHGYDQGHPAIPMGCDCYREKETIR